MFRPAWIHVYLLRFLMSFDNMILEFSNESSPISDVQNNMHSITSAELLMCVILHRNITSSFPFQIQQYIMDLNQITADIKKAEALAASVTQVSSSN